MRGEAKNRAREETLPFRGDISLDFFRLTPQRKLGSGSFNDSYQTVPLYVRKILRGTDGFLQNIGSIFSNSFYPRMTHKRIYVKLDLMQQSIYRP